MAKLIVIWSVILAVTVISANALALPEVLLQNTKIQFATPEQIKDFLKENPNAVELQRQVQEKESEDHASVAPRYTINYYLGQRTPVDYRVAHDFDRHAWDQPRDVQITLQYPSQGVGKIVTFVDVYVNQSSMTGRAYVTAGGIGYRYIHLVVEAVHTNYFNYDISIYGQD